MSPAPYEKMRRGVPLVGPYRPSEAAGRALDDWAALAAAPSPWPGWNLRLTPLALVVPLGGGLFFAGHPDAGPQAAPVEPGPWEAHLGPVTWLPATGGTHVAGPAVYPLLVRGVVTLFAVPGRARDDLGPLLWGEAFRLHLRSRLGIDDPRLAVAYPVDDPVMAALATVEGRLLRDAGDGRAVALLRRERRGPLDDEFVAYERAAEQASGLPAYVAESVARACGWAATEPATRLDDLGAQPLPRRLEASGMAVALALDRIAPGWQAEVRGPLAGGLEAVLERDIRFDGGEGDEAVITASLARYGYPDLLAAARARADQAVAARQSVLDSILNGRGSLLAFNVAGLGQASVDASEPGETVHKNLAVYRGEVRFRYGAAELRFSGVPVAQDLRAGLLQARVRGALHLAGDGRRIEMDEEAEFTDGLSLDLPGVHVRARRGVLKSISGGLYVELKP